MEARVVHGRLEPPSSAPAQGERSRLQCRLGEVEISQILSGALSEPVSFLDEHDEWVLVLAGGARLLADGRAHELREGDWLLLPAGCPHSLEATEPGTSWLELKLARP